MAFQKGLKFQSLVEFWEHLPENEQILVDVLRQITLETLPAGCKEKLTFNVPYYYGSKRICFIWPASVPWGGFSEGVMLGFSQGKKLADPDHYLTHGTNKQVFYKIFREVGEINEPAITALLKEAVIWDGRFA